jgi:hypothetical protein
MLVIYLSHAILLDMTTFITFHDLLKLCSFPQHPLPCSYLGPQIFLSVLFSNSFSLFCNAPLNYFGAWLWPSTPSSAEVKERVELYLYSTSGPSWSVLGWTLLLPLPLNYLPKGYLKIPSVDTPERLATRLGRAAFVWS